MTDPLFFGYGSLVNLATHGYADARPARLRGWRRVWRCTVLRPAAFLSVEPAPEVEILGVVARVPGADWAALDLREAAYRRIDCTTEVAHDGPGAPCAVYQVDPAHHDPAVAAHPILLSYLDAVVQGFLRLHGPEGAAHFLKTTTGWTRVHDDRAAPLYPRHQRLAPEETAAVDRLLGRLRG